MRSPVKAVSSGQRVMLLQSHISSRLDFCCEHGVVHFYTGWQTLSILFKEKLAEQIIHTADLTVHGCLLLDIKIQKKKVGWCVTYIKTEQHYLHISKICLFYSQQEIKSTISGKVLACFSSYCAPRSLISVSDSSRSFYIIHIKMKSGPHGFRNISGNHHLRTQLVVSSRNAGLNSIMQWRNYMLPFSVSKLMEWAACMSVKETSLWCRRFQVPHVCSHVFFREALHLSARRC